MSRVTGAGVLSIASPLEVISLRRNVQFELKVFAGCGQVGDENGFTA